MHVISSVTFLMIKTFFSPFADTNSEDEDLNSQYADEDESRLKVQMKV